MIEPQLAPGPRSGPFRVRIEARQRWMASARVSRRTRFEADPVCSGTETKKMMVENARGGEADYGCRPGCREKAEPTPLRNEAQLNCVSLRPELDDEVTWGAVQGQGERPLPAAPLTAPQVTHRRSYAARKKIINN